MVEATNDKELNFENSNGRFIAPWASGEHLRKIEREVLIPNLMKKKAKVVCQTYLETFGACVHGKTISLAWKCGKEKQAMANCLKEQLDKPELLEECRIEYLQTREEFQKHYVETGEKTKQKKKSPAIF